MPELPEVETVKRGLEPWLLNRTITGAEVRIERLRLPIPEEIHQLHGQTIHKVHRRAKYLLIDTDQGHLIYHLGMSGSMRIIKQNEPPKAHDHVDLLLDNGRALRFNDPRRFGIVLWCEPNQLAQHQLLAHLGPEPFDDRFTAQYLKTAAGQRKTAIKNFIMDGHVVVGVGNIYASESLHIAGIHPHRAAGRISLSRYEKLVQAIQDILQAAIDVGGTTLKDFVDSEGNPGYFFRELMVYDRADEDCKQCGCPIKRTITGQRSTYYCPQCQR